MKIFGQQAFKEFLKFLNYRHCVKSARIRSFCGPYFPTFEMNTKSYGIQTTNTDHQNSEYGHFSRSEVFGFIIKNNLPHLNILIMILAHPEANPCRKRGFKTEDTKYAMPEVSFSKER